MAKGQKRNARAHKKPKPGRAASSQQPTLSPETRATLESFAIGRKK